MTSKELLERYPWIVDEILAEHDAKQRAETARLTAEIKRHKLIETRRACAHFHGTDLLEVEL